MLPKGKVLKDRNDYFGDVVNVAARIESKGEPSSIYVSKVIHVDVKDSVTSIFQRKERFKGKSEPFPVYKIIWNDKTKSKPFKSYLNRLTKNRTFKLNLLITLLITLFFIPFVNYYNLNLLTKIWQCKLTLIPNSNEVVVITMGDDDYKKMIVGQNEPPPESFHDNPKSWRRYHSKLIKKLYDFNADVVAFDLWFSPTSDTSIHEPTRKFIESLKFAASNGLPIVIGQHRNSRDPRIYNNSKWGYITVQKDVTWIDQVMYMPSFDSSIIQGRWVTNVSFFLQILAQKLNMTPSIEDDKVVLIGKPIPNRLWLKFSKTPITTIPYYEIYNGWIEKKEIENKIVLIGLNMKDLDMFEVPYSPTDYTPMNKDDGHRMPGVFLHAHALNQIINGQFYDELQDEWYGFFTKYWTSKIQLKALFILLFETAIICGILYLFNLFSNKFIGNTFARIFILFTSSALIIFYLAKMPIIFGLFNFIMPSFVFSILLFQKESELTK